MPIAFTARARNRILCDDAALEAAHRRKGFLQRDHVYGYVNIWRNLQTGGVQHSPIFHTRVDALESIAPGDDPLWVRESTQPVATLFDDAPLHGLAMHAPESTIPARPL